MLKKVVDPADGLMGYEVGAWTREKHDYLERYIGATRRVRARFVPKGSGKAGAAFIDLFAGPGRARIRGSKEWVDGSPLIAAQHSDAPFTDIICCEMDKAAADSLRRRLGNDDRVRIFEDDCNRAIDDIVASLPPAGLNLALIDPFGATPLQFETLAKLAGLERMDILLHFPTADLERNLQHEERIDRMLGTERWRDRVSGPEDVHVLAEVLKERLEPFGYENGGVHYDPALKTGVNRTLYRLLFLSKHPRGAKIWNSVILREGSGQKRLF
jgi:three-Cys-motif partner protein